MHMQIPDPRILERLGARPRGARADAAAAMEDCFLSDVRGH
jgi:hypothetical protein